MELITVIFAVIRNVLVEFGGAITNLFGAITQIFFTVDGTGEFYTLTPIGVLSLITFGVGLIWTGIRWLSRLIKLRG